jgi:hypothetical protein
VLQWSFSFRPASPRTRKRKLDGIGAGALPTSDRSTGQAIALARLHEEDVLLPQSLP